MFKRVVITGTTPDVTAQFKTKMEERGAIVFEQAPGAAPADHATCVVCASEATDAVFDAAFAAGSQNDALLGLLADAVDAREDIPAGASERVRQHALRLGEALALDREQLSMLERGALLRSIGKILIPNSVLLKTTVLDYDDWVLVQSHTTLGAQLLSDRGVCPDITDIVRCYHECWDGTGYPQGIEGEAIPLLARIMRLVDVFCAMTTPRTYRKTHATLEEALAHVKAERGKHFDPRVVDAFIASGSQTL